MRITESAVAGYQVADTDTASDTKYYGYTWAGGKWYIMQEVTSAGTFRYVSGTSGYAAAWTARAGKSYDYFHLAV